MVAVVAAAATLVAAAATTATVASCGGLHLTPVERFQKILGHLPTGRAANVAAAKKLIVANAADNPPQSFIDPTSKQLVGFDVDVAKRVGEILGVDVEFVNPNWDNVAAGLAKNSYDVAIGSIPITSTRAKTMSFTAPYAYQSAEVLTRRGDPAITSTADLQGKTIGVDVQSVYQFWLQQLGGVAVRVFNDETDAYQALREGQVDGVMTSQAAAGAALDASKSLEASGPVFFYQPLGFATATGQPDLVKVLDHAIAQMRKDGSLARISKKWYGGEDLTRAPSDSVPRFEQ